MTEELMEEQNRINKVLEAATQLAYAAYPLLNNETGSTVGHVVPNEAYEYFLRCCANFNQCRKEQAEAQMAMEMMGEHNEC